jgi:hypothetical protein
MVYVFAIIRIRYLTATVFSPVAAPVTFFKRAARPNEQTGQTVSIAYTFQDHGFLRKMFRRRRRHANRMCDVYLQRTVRSVASTPRQNTVVALQEEYFFK